MYDIAAWSQWRKEKVAISIRPNRLFDVGCNADDLDNGILNGSGGDIHDVSADHAVLGPCSMSEDEEGDSTQHPTETAQEERGSLEIHRLTLARRMASRSRIAG